MYPNVSKIYKDILRYTKYQAAAGPIKTRVRVAEFHNNYDNLVDLAKRNRADKATVDTMVASLVQLGLSPGYPEWTDIIADTRRRPCICRVGPEYSINLIKYNQCMIITINLINFNQK